MNDPSPLTYYAFGLFVDFRNIPESQWLSLMNLGYSPALDIFHANHGGRPASAMPIRRKTTLIMDFKGYPSPGRLFSPFIRRVKRLPCRGHFYYVFTWRRFGLFARHYSITQDGWGQFYHQFIIRQRVKRGEDLVNRRRIGWDE